MPDSRASSTWKSVPAWCHAARGASARHDFQQRRDGVEVAVRRAPAGQAHRGGLQRRAEFRQRGDLGQIDRRHHPVAAVTPHQFLGLQAQQRGADRRARAVEAGFQPTLGQALAGAKVEGKDHLPEASIDVEHL